ncbi:MAG: diadenylate cyclase CdaA [Firmicutes bacterium]|nr:diadenylate cyclase CdaA [Bacillota bacterium]MBR3393823.1 diadenylate cyclase CdaA [Bacillota bacterium]
MDSILSGFFPDGTSFSSLIPAFRFTDVLDIIGVAILIYLLISWVRKTRAWVLFKGILFVLVIWLVAVIFSLNMMMWIFQNVFNIGILAIVIIFQPELRRALEKLGTNNVLTRMLSVGTGNTVNERTAESITRAMVSMAEVKTGALICVERQVALGEYEQTGIPLNADVSSQLLINIFEKNTPLHDGAIIIRQNRILAATCYLPLSDDNDISKELGTRHRAALGLSEVSDAKVFIVSEETGAMSMAVGGQIYRNLTADRIKQELLGIGPEDRQRVGNSGVSNLRELLGIKRGAGKGE